MHIALIPMSTGSGHNMRMYAIVQALHQPAVKMHVYLSSLQTTFSSLFQECSVEVHDTTPEHTADHSRHAHLRSALNWDTFLEGYIEPHFLNSQRIARLVYLLLQNPPDVVVSDYDFCAVIAAALINVPCVLITERYNFTIVSVDNEALQNAGFQVDCEEIDKVRIVLNRLFTWLTSYCSAVLTDKPYVQALDAGTYAEQLFQTDKMRFVGPMIRPIPQVVDQAAERAQYGCTMDDFLLVASLGGTTMFSENVDLQQQLYLDSYLRVRQTVPNARMILITRSPIEKELPEGVVCVPYIPDWLSLLCSTDLVLAHPGWITVTELSAIGVPSIFVLASPREYHELEALQRLHLLEYETHVGTDAEALAQRIVQLRSPAVIERVRQVYLNVAPHNNGAYLAAAAILAAAFSHRRENAISKDVSELRSQKSTRLYGQP